MGILQEQIVLAERGVRLVLADLTRTTSHAPEIVVDDLDGTVRITYNGSFYTPSIWSTDDAGVVAEVADYVQEHAMEAMSSVWPARTVHSVGAHAEVHAATAVWWCRTGEHALAEIGTLSA